MRFKREKLNSHQALEPLVEAEITQKRLNFIPLRIKLNQKQNKIQTSKKIYIS